jgi:uncharacterized membrane protein
MIVEDEKTKANRTMTHAIYALYAVSLFVGVTALVGIVLNYIKRDDMAGTMYESHFRWQIRTSGSACCGASSAPSPWSYSSASAS